MILINSGSIGEFVKMKNTKLQRLEEKFSLAQTLVEDLSTLVEDIPLDDFLPIEYSTEGALAELKPNESIIDLNQMKMDFQIVRQNILKVVNSGNRILEEVSVVDISDLKPSHIVALAQLQTALGQNISLLLNSYKEIAIIEKSRMQPVKGTSKEVPNVNGDLNQTNINLFSGSSAQLLELISNQGKVIDVVDVS